MQLLLRGVHSRTRDQARPERILAAGQNVEGIDPGDFEGRQSQVAEDVRPNAERLRLARAEQSEVDVTAGCVAGHALVADQLACLAGLARSNDDPAEMGVDAAIAVAVV